MFCAEGLNREEKEEAASEAVQVNVGQVCDL
jgi:hypothetical protein